MISQILLELISEVFIPVCTILERAARNIVTGFDSRPLSGEGDGTTISRSVEERDTGQRGDYLLSVSLEGRGGGVGVGTAGSR
ncbi:hypothetical protein RRG08_057642 [Elysia crispata]|uniref:Uncharacterized protein n=1 Tax=Elysia crispata TaxID=231223 RepID=A0AAE1A1J4_9GAST|nr:hypothetical protein RRG08_057642 [Elysia crispata]